MPSVLAEPVGDVAERFRLQATGSPLSLPPLLDESGALEHLHFLLQHVDLNHQGRRSKGIEVIGHERQFGGEPSEDIKSRYYGGEGDTLDYVYELVDDTLTIWGGERGSPAYFRGTFDDPDSLTGAWVWPGGGYKSRMTRIKDA